MTTREVEAMTQWQPIETAPTGKRVLVCVASIQKHRCVIALKVGFGRTGDELWLAENMQPMTFHPSHWMPLPPPPTEGKE